MLALAFMDRILLHLALACSSSSHRAPQRTAQSLVPLAFYLQQQPNNFQLALVMGWKKAMRLSPCLIQGLGRIVFKKCIHVQVQLVIPPHFQLGFISLQDRNNEPSLFSSSFVIYQSIFFLSILKISAQLQLRLIYGVVRKSICFPILDFYVFLFPCRPNERTVGWGTEFHGTISSWRRLGEEGGREKKFGEEGGREKESESKHRTLLQRHFRWK